MNRGDVVDVDLPQLGRRPVVIVTRQIAIEFLANVTVVMVTLRIRGLPSEVPLDRDDGLDGECVANCDNVLTVPKSAIAHVRGQLGPAKIDRLDRALAGALGLDEEA